MKNHAAGLLETMTRAQQASSARAAKLEASGKRKPRPAVWLCAACGSKLVDDACPFHGLSIPDRRRRAFYHLQAEPACGCELCERAAIIAEGDRQPRDVAERRAVDELFPFSGDPEQ